MRVPLLSCNCLPAVVRTTLPAGVRALPPPAISCYSLYEGLSSSVCRSPSSTLERYFKIFVLVALRHLPTGRCIPFREGWSTFPARRRRLRITCLALEHTRLACHLPACRDRPTCFSCLTFWRTVWAAGRISGRPTGVCGGGMGGERERERERSRRERQSAVTGRLRSVAVSRLVFATTLGRCRMKKKM